MTRRPTPPARIAGAALGAIAAGTLLAGCASAGGGADASDGSSSSSSNSDVSTQTSTYQDGTYQAEGSYTSPGGQETIGVKVTLKSGAVSAVTVTPEATSAQSKSYQQQFANGISSQVVGKSLDEISVDKVAGSSLTSEGFAAALERIKSDASA